MPAQILAELTAGGEAIVLVAGGSDREVTAAAKRLQTLTPLFSKTDPAGALSVPATWPAVVQLSTTFGAAWHPGPRLQQWVCERATERVQPAPIGYTPPAGLTPYPWQLEGAAMIAATGKVLITDEPGTGKTITTILGLVEWQQRPDTWVEGPVLVIAPASVVDPWVDAWATWAHHVRVTAYRGPKRKALLAQGQHDVYVTSYDTARIDATEVKGFAALRELNPAAVVVDECHMIKNPRAARSRAVRTLSKGACAVVALSGTPITHHPGDLWASLDALEHDAWPSRTRWVNRYCETLPGDYDEEILGLQPATEAEFRTTMLGRLRRVAKADVLADLPPKVYSVRTVELPPKWRKAYDDMESQMLAELPSESGPGTELSVMSALAKLTRLGQLASAPAKVETTYETGEDGIEREHVSVQLEGPSWKVEALLEVVAERPGQPIVVFAPSKQLIRLAGAAAIEAGYRVGYLTGDVTGPGRAAVVEAFQGGELDLICVTTGAGGVGITLTAASTCVFLQRPWALVEAMQAEDRLHRIGAEGHDSIEVIDIVAKSTIDSRVRAVLRERAGQLADLVEDPRIVAELLGGSARSEAAA